MNETNEISPNETRDDALRELIGAYVDDALPQETRRRVEALLLRDRNAAWEAQSLRITRERLRGEMGEVVASDAFRARVLAKLRADNGHLSPAANENADEWAQVALPILMG